MQSETRLRFTSLSSVLTYVHTYFGLDAKLLKIVDMIIVSMFNKLKTDVDDVKIMENGKDYSENLSLSLNLHVRRTKKISIKVS